MIFSCLNTKHLNCTSCKVIIFSLSVSTFTNQQNFLQGDTFFPLSISLSSLWLTGLKSTNYLTNLKPHKPPSTGSPCLLSQHKPRLFGTAGWPSWPYQLSMCYYCNNNCTCQPWQSLTPQNMAHQIRSFNVNRNWGNTNLNPLQLSKWRELVHLGCWNYSFIHSVVVFCFVFSPVDLFSAYKEIRPLALGLDFLSKLGN